MADEQELQVKVNVTADTAGADKAQSSLRGVNSELSNLRKGLGATRNSTAVFEGIERAAQGGTQAIVGSARAFRGFFQIVAEGTAATGPIGLLLVALGALVGLFIALGRHSKEAGEGLKQGAKSADEFKTAISALEKGSKVDLEAMKKQVDEVTNKYDELLARMKEADARISRTNKAQQGLDEANLDVTTQRALGAATSDEERENIQRRSELAKRAIGLKYEAIDIGNTSLRSGLQRGNANEQVQRAEDLALAQRDQAVGLRLDAEDLKAQATSATQRAIGASQAAGGAEVTRLSRMTPGAEFDAVNSLGMITAIEKSAAAPGQANAEALASATAKHAKGTVFAARVADKAASIAESQADAAQDALKATIRSAEKEQEAADTESEIVEVEKKTLAAKQAALDAAGGAETSREAGVAGKDAARTDAEATRAAAAAQRGEDKALDQEMRGAMQVQKEQAHATSVAAREAAQAQKSANRALQAVFREQKKAFEETHKAMRETSKSLGTTQSQIKNSASYAPQGP